jgi:hypothetical protein
MPDLDLSLSDLNHLARLGDVELRAPDRDGGRRIEQGQGWCGGRLMRNLRVGLGDEDRTGKRDSYMAVKQAVLKALEDEYGAEVAKRAFVAGAGRIGERGEVESSADHPLTGRHIRKMLEHAETERRSPLIGKARLEALALHDELEIGGTPEHGLVARPGGVGGKLLRNVGLEKPGLYAESKKMVYQALEQLYGEDIAREAFLAGAGHEDDQGGVFSSADRPLTGAQLRRMLEQAERATAGHFVAAIKQAFGEVDPSSGQVRWRRDGDHPSWDSPALREKLDELMDEVVGRQGLSRLDAVRIIRQRLIPVIAVDLEVPHELIYAVARHLDAMDRELQPGGGPRETPGPPPPLDEGMGPSEAERALEALLKSEEAPEDAPQRFLHALETAFGQRDEDTGRVRWRRQEGRPLWESSAGLLQALEDQVLRHAEQEGTSLLEAVGSFRMAVIPRLVENLDVPQELTLKLARGLLVLEREQILGQALGCPPQHVWRLVVPGESKLELEPQTSSRLNRSLKEFLGIMQLSRPDLERRFAIGDFWDAPARAQDEDERLAIVARAIRTVCDDRQDLDPATARALLQRLLREAGLPPAMLPGDLDPKLLTGDDLREGQEGFRNIA